MVIPTASVAEPAALRSLASEALDALALGGVAGLPAFSGLPWGAVARWFVRGAGGGPLYLCPPVDGAAGWADALEVARGGWVGVEWSVTDAQVARARDRGVRVLRRAGPERADAECAAWLAGQDPWHGVASDPALEEVRRSLLAHCRSGAAVHLVGPAGTGKRSLVRWAHAALDDRPLSTVSRGEARGWTPGRWAYFEELGELEPEQVARLREVLHARDVRTPLVAPPPPEERPAHPAFARILGSSPALCRVLREIARVAPMQVPVLILGESGVGKELLARAVHDASGRKGPYRALDVSALAESLVESELFGHVRGAFTGAERDRPGAFRQCHGGTIFLDELGNLSPRVQTRLLRVLQERQVVPVGSDQTVTVDVRVVAATNADLEAMIARGQFRADLLRRLDAVTLHVPPLRERVGDIPLLAGHFYRSHAPDAPADWIDPEALRALQAWPWPGNIRDLWNVTARAAVHAGGGRVTLAALGPIAPTEQRAAPVLTTSSDDDWAARDTFSSDRRLVHRVRAVTLRLDPVRLRSPVSVRNAVLTRLDGHRITADALRLLEHAPWPGNWTELAAALDTLRANLPDGITRAGIERTLHGVVGAGREPLRLLLHPTAADGEPQGQLLELDTDALVVGRVATLAQAARLAEGDPSLAKRLAEVRAELRGGEAHCLELPYLARLSRLHLAIRRVGTGLSLRAWGAGVWAGGLDEPLTPLEPGSPRALGPAAEIQVRIDGAAGPYLHAFVFGGAQAQEEARPAVLARLGRAPPAPTVDVQVDSPTAAPGRTTIWEVDESETEWLVEAVATFEGDDFKAALEARMAETQQSHPRLVRYLAGSRPTQAAGRLFEHPPNARLRARCAARIDALPDPEELLERLPTAIRRALSDLAG